MANSNEKQLMLISRYREGERNAEKNGIIETCTNIWTMQWWKKKNKN